jgi:hypothetical protein
MFNNVPTHIYIYIYIYIYKKYYTFILLIDIMIGIINNNRGLVPPIVLHLLYFIVRKHSNLSSTIFDRLCLQLLTFSTMVYQYII